MSLLLDSQTLLWAMMDSPRLGTKARSLLEQQVDTVYVSAASVWELAIKRSHGGIDLPEDFVDKLAEAGFEILSVTASLCWKAAHLPHHHADPFDRLIIAQALDRAMTVMTTDSIFPSYGPLLVDAAR